MIEVNTTIASVNQEVALPVMLLMRSNRFFGAIVDLIGVVLFLLPLCGLLALMAYDFAAAAWSIHETSREPGGLPYPMIPLMKSLVIFMPVAVAFQGISLLTRSITTIRRQ